MEKKLSSQTRAIKKEFDIIDDIQDYRASKQYGEGAVKMFGAIHFVDDYIDPNNIAGKSKYFYWLFNCFL